MSSEFTPITHAVEGYLQSDTVQPRLDDLQRLADQIHANRTPGTDQ